MHLSFWFFKGDHDWRALYFEAKLELIGHTLLLFILIVASTIRYLLLLLLLLEVG